MKIRDEIREQTRVVIQAILVEVDRIREKFRHDLDPYDSGRGNVVHMMILSRKIEERLKFVDVSARDEARLDFESRACSRSNFPRMCTMPSTEVRGQLINLVGKWAKKDHVRLLRETANRHESSAHQHN